MLGTSVADLPFAAGVACGVPLLNSDLQCGPAAFPKSLCGGGDTILKPALQAPQLVRDLEDCLVVTGHQPCLASCWSGEPT